jgi:hypothetical protein
MHSIKDKSGKFNALHKTGGTIDLSTSLAIYIPLFLAVYFTASILTTLQITNLNCCFNCATTHFISVLLRLHGR